MELTDYWKVLRAHWLSVLLITLLGGAAAFGWTLLQPRVYSANASGIIAAGVSSDLGAALAGDNYAKSRVKSYLDVAKSRTVATSVAEELGLDDPPESLVARISVENPLDTAVIKVTAEAATPEAARDLAEAWVRGISDQVTELENANVPTGSETSSIVTFNSLDNAVLPTAPTSPNTRLAVALGLLAGFAVGVGYALLRNVFDRRIRSVDQLEEQFGVPVVGTIPFDKNFTDEDRIASSQGGNDTRSRDSYDFAVAEAVRELRTNLQFMSVDDPPRRIVVTSSLPGEGKSTVTANLAVTIAASGQRVVVIDGDLRRPTLAKAFGLVPGVGLTDVLIGRVELNQVLQPWGDTGRLFVLGAGAIPPNPSELLGSNAMQTLLEELAKYAVVLIDAPPLIPVTDAAILSARTDGAFVVAYARRTTYDALGKALQNLERVKGRALGIILNGVPRKGADASSYGYHYKSYYGTARRLDETHAPGDVIEAGDASAVFAAPGPPLASEGRRAAS
ncbi:polysaccharide biosynthesis tyrosine autokinase [Agromyces bauzanensis]